MSKFELPSVDGVKAIGLIVAIGAATYIAYRMWKAGDAIADTVGNTGNSIASGIVDIFGAKPQVRLTDAAQVQAAENADTLKSMDAAFKQKAPVGKLGVVDYGYGDYTADAQVDSPDASGLSYWEQVSNAMVN